MENEKNGEMKKKSEICDQEEEKVVGNFCLMSDAL